MDQERRSIRLGLAVIACAAIFRLLGGGLLDSAAQFLSQPRVLSFLLYLQTGQVVSAAAPEVPSEPVSAETTPTVPLPEDRPFALPEADASLFTLYNSTSYDPPLEELYRQPLLWQLKEQQPTVLILHTHATEGYTQTAQDTYDETSAYRTLDKTRSVVSIGAYVAQILEQGGVRVIHDTTLHDYPEYTGSYGRARAVIQGYLQRYPSIRLILDLHRDASDSNAGSQLNTSAQVHGEAAAQLMLVVGTGQGGLSHPDWQENLAFALKLQAALEASSPGLCRPISLRTERFNQDLLPGALLVEMGAAGDTRQEALNTARALAEGILQLANGSVTADSQS